MQINLKEMFDDIVFDKTVDPRQGIGTEALDAISCLTPIVNVDLLIKNPEGKVLVSWRDDDICGSGWHLPGGIVRYKENLLDRVHKTAVAELGVDVNVDEKPLEINEIILEQEKRGHFISILYMCKPVEEISVKTETTLTPGELHWYDYGKDEQLVKGQRGIYTKYLEG